jgi:hypothetical protein
MATYPPPNFIEPLTIFNRINWRTPLEAQQQVSPINPANFLQFPVAQGTETFADLISVGTANLTNISIADTTSVSSTSISQSTAGVLSIDNNQTISGSIVFKANNSASIEQTILSLSGDTGTTATLPMTINNALTINGNAIITNGIYSSTLDMDTNNDFLITNNKANQRIILTALDTSLIATNTATIGASANGGFVVSSSIGRAITALSTSASSNTNSIGISATAARVAIEGKSNSPSASSTRSIALGVAGDIIFNSITSTNDGFIIGGDSVSNVGVLTLSTYSSSRLGVRINSNSINSVEVAGALIQLNATTNGGITSTTPQPIATDNSTKIPTTAWVQSAISSNPAIIPYYQTTCFFRNLAYGRSANIVFNFSGPAWGLNDFFTINFRYEVNSVLTGSVSTQPTTDFTIVSGSVDIYPYRCPVNVATDTAYGIGQASTTPSNFPQFNNNIYKPSTSSYSSAFDLGTNDATYYPYGRYFWVTNYSITQQGTQYSQTSPTNNLLPLQPYIPTGSVGQQNFGFAMWNYNTTSTYTQYNNLFLQLVNRGQNPITITGNYLVFGDAVVKTSGF